MLSPTEKLEFKDFSRLLRDFPVLFKADLIFKDFSSLCEPCYPFLRLGDDILGHFYGLSFSSTSF